MSLSNVAVMVAAKLQVQQAQASTPQVDRCLLYNKTNGIAQDIWFNIQNFLLGPGKWIALAMFGIGVLTYMAGNSNLIKKGGAALVIIALIGAVVAIATGLVGNSNCSG